MAARILAVAAGLYALVSPARGSSIAAYYRAPFYGAQVIHQNATTGDINYSLCASAGTPIFPTNPPKSFQLPYAAKNGTSVAATGWFDGTNIFSTIFYQSINYEIVSAVYKCDMKTGEFMAFSNYVISSVKIAPAPHTSTGLAINLLGSAGGEHVYYHDSDMAVHSYHFTNDAGWTYGGMVSPDRNLSSMALTASFLGSNETIYTPKIGGNVEASVYNTDQTWHITSFPKPLNDTKYNSTSNETSLEYSSNNGTFTLPDWDGKVKALGASIDRDNAKYMFYIGTDKKLHQATSFINSGEYQDYIMQQGLGEDLWPVADEPNADFGVAFNPASYDVSIFYFSNGSLVALNQTTKFGGWQTAYTLPTVNLTANADTGSSGSGLSTGAKAGIGVGVSIACLLIIAGIAACCFARRRRHQQLDHQQADPNEMVMDQDGTMIPATQMSTQMTGQPPYDYSQVGQWDYSQQDYSQQQWGADKKAVSPNPHDMYGSQARSIGVEMPDSSLAPFRLSELPSTYHMSHELPAGEVDQIQETPLEPQSAYAVSSLRSTDIVTGGEAMITPGSPRQRPMSALSWTAASPPTNCVSQNSSPTPSIAYPQPYHQPPQPVSPQLTGASADYQYQQPQVHAPEGGYAQQDQSQSQQHIQQVSLGAITEQNEVTHNQYYQQQQQHEIAQYYQRPQQQEAVQYYQPQQQEAIQGQYYQQPQQHEAAQGQYYQQQPQQQQYHS